MKNKLTKAFATTAIASALITGTTIAPAAAAYEEYPFPTWAVCTWFPVFC